MIKSLSEWMGTLHIHHPPKEWTHQWEQVYAKYHDERQLHFLSHEYLMEANVYFKLHEDQLDALGRAMALIRGRADLTALAWLWRCLLYEGHDPDANDLANWPVPVTAMGADAPMFPLAIAISNLPWLIEYYKKCGISDAILYDTLSDVRIVMEESRNRTGVWGIENFLLGWLLNHFSGRLVRIGRLQYMPRRCDLGVGVYRHCKSGKVIALAEDESSIARAAGFAEGFPITPQGKTLTDKVKLPLAQWKAVFEQGDFLLDVHIPRGDKLEHMQLAESYRNAIQAFQQWFPERRFKGFVCHTWMFDPRLCEILPAASNLVKFQRDYYLYRLVDDDAIYESLFVRKPKDLRDLPEATSLQRSMKHRALSGERMQSGAGFLLFDDLDQGPSYYQRNGLWEMKTNESD